MGSGSSVLTAAAFSLPLNSPSEERPLGSPRSTLRERGRGGEGDLDERRTYGVNVNGG